MGMQNVDWNNLQRRLEEKYIPEPNSGCHLWLGALDIGGYGVIATGTKTPAGSKLTIAAHRASFLLHNGPSSLDGGYFACHRCDLRCCVNPNHLFKGDGFDYMQDAANKGRLRSALTADEVMAILEDDDYDTVIAAKYNVDRKTIGNIKTGRSWKHVSGIAHIQNRRLPMRTSASQAF
jgi:hypothetical protein